MDRGRLTLLIAALALLVALTVPATAAAATTGVWGWGLDSSGQLGNGQTAGTSGPVFTLAGATGSGPLTGVTQTASGQHHSLALLSNGTVVAWGDDSSGQLGNGTVSSTPSTTPVQVTGFPAGTTLTAVAAGGNNSYALDSAGHVWAWGDNSSDQLGDGNTGANQAYSQSPVAVVNANGAQLTGATALAAGSAFAIGLSTINGVSVVYAWGDNTYGQLGNGTTGGSSSTATPVVNTGGTGTLPNITEIAAGYRHAVALYSARPDLYTWGDNTYGQLGNGTTGGSSGSPILVGSPLGAKAIAAGGYHSLVLVTAGVETWGDNSNGQLGNGKTGGASGTLSTVVGPGGSGTLSGVSAIGAGLYDSYALSGSSVLSWGADNVDQLGDNGSGDQPAPVASALVEPASGLGTGGTGEHALVIAQAAPAAITGQGSGATQTAMTLNGTVNPEGANVTDCHFDWGTSLSYGNQVACSPSPGSGTSPVSVSASLSGLTPGTTYHFRVVASNGGTADGADASYSTTPLPAITSVSPASGRAAGGTNVTITGSGFTFANAVYFGTTAATSYAVQSDTQITATAPAGSGQVDVRVASPAGMSVVVNADHYGYQAAPKQQTSPPPASLSGGTSEIFTAIVNPEGLSTSAYFQYGLDPAYAPRASTVNYTNSTPIQNVGSDFTNHTVRAVVTGLQPNSLYHYRVVTANSAGSQVGPDATFKTAPAAPPPPPVRGKSVTLKPIKGRVYVRVPHSRKFVLLTEAIQVVVGSIVDATHGTVELTSARTGRRNGPVQSALFFDGEFVVTQQRTSARTNLKLTGGASCPRAAADLLVAGRNPFATAAGGPTHKLKRKLWGNGHGQFTTQGQNASASVQGTYWLTEDFCDGTLVKVRRGVVKVQDFVHHKTVLVRAGHSYFT